MRRLVTVLFLLLAAHPVASSSAWAREELTIGITQFPSTLHPNFDLMTAKSYVLGMARRPFTTYDAHWRLICMLCTELPTMENGRAVAVERPDGTRGVQVRYTIQPDARWGDGTPITTADVLFTWEVGRHPQSGVANTELYRRIERIEVHDAKSFTLHLTKLTFEFAAINDFQLVPAHIERARFEQDPAAYRDRTAYNTEPTNPGLYFGPYRITQVAGGSHLVLERNPTWWGSPPAFNRITVRVIENTAALEANLLSGAVDYIAGELGVSLDQALALERRHGQRFAFVYRPGLSYEHVDLQLGNPILADRRVRRALLLGLDRHTLVQQIFDNRQPVAATFVNPLDWIIDADLPAPGFDPVAAARLLDEAGWNQIRDGVRVNAAGERLSLELMSTAGNRVRETVEQVMQSQWRRIGIEVRIRNEAPRVFFGETLRRRQFTGLAMFAWTSSPENVPRSTLHSDEITRPENGFGGQNYTGFRNAEMDRLIDQTELELDRERRRALWYRIQRIYAEELPVLPLYFRADPYIMPRWLVGIEPTGHQYPTTLWVETWHEQ